MATDPSDEIDAEVLAELAAHGVDLTQPLVIEFPVTAPDEPAARAIAQVLEQAGHACQVEFDPGEADPEALVEALQAEGLEGDEVEPDEFGPSWSVVVTRTMVPELAELMRLQAELDRLSGPFGGVSDGWSVTLDLMHETEDEDEDEEVGPDA